MLTIIFARHGRYTAQTLTEEGISQAHMLGKMLSTQNLAALTIISSPSQRALQTSKIIGAELGGIAVATVSTLALDSSHDLNYHADNISAITARYLETFEAIPKESDNILVVTHEPNVIGFTLAFAKAAGKSYFDPMTCGAVSYQIEAETWEDVVELMKSDAEDIAEISLVYRVETLQLG